MAALSAIANVEGLIESIFVFPNEEERLSG